MFFLTLPFLWRPTWINCDCSWILICVARLVGSLRNSWKKITLSHCLSIAAPVTRNGENTRVSRVLNRGDLMVEISFRAIRDWLVCLLELEDAWLAGLINWVVVASNHCQAGHKHTELLTKHSLIYYQLLVNYHRWLNEILQYHHNYSWWC